MLKKPFSPVEKLRKKLRKILLIKKTSYPVKTQEEKLNSEDYYPLIKNLLISRELKKKTNALWS